MVTIILVLGIGLIRNQGSVMKEIRGMQAQTDQIVTTTTRPAQVVSSCSALIAVFFAWRTFTGFRRRRES
jgi:hypothetical protein